MSLRFCPKDKMHVVSTSDSFCEECGSAVALLKCTNGHERFTERAKFCWQCGVPVEPLTELLQLPLKEEQL